MSSPDERDPYAPPPENGPPEQPAAGPSSGSEDGPAGGPVGRPSTGPPPPPYGQPYPQPYGEPYAQPHGQSPDPETGPGRRASPPPGPVDPGGRRALLFALAGAAMSVVFFPIGIVLDVTAIVLAFRARRRAARAGGKAPFSGPAVIISGVGLAFAAGLLAFTAIFFDEFRAYQSCLSGANTEVARQECNDEFRIDVENRFG